MDIKIINGIEVIVAGAISNEELSMYLSQLQEKQNFKIIKASIVVDDEYINVNYKFECVPFERIRRITGYLVGTTARWGNAKRAEEKDRIKHGLNHYDTLM
ncbi:MAG: hypothetical protein H7X79_12660 [Sporomusaceae bacterium]|nr:hypothetical protein [Sporomusaceae bacterium]